MPKEIPHIACNREDERDSSPDPDGKIRTQAVAKKVSDELAARLRMASDPTEEAVGAYLQMTAASVDAMQAVSATRSDCVEDRECIQQALDAAATAASPFVADIARLASTSNRADVYPIGIAACRWAADSVASSSWCAQLSPIQWARLEPDNAMPWIFVAGDASKRGDNASRDDALFHASLAKTNDLHWSAFGDLTNRGEIQAQPLDVQAAVDLGILGSAEAMSIPPYDATMKYCAVDAVTDVNRRQVCANLATVMVDHADDLLGLSLGLMIGERVGWPVDRLDKIRNKKDAYFQFAFDQAITNVTSCDELRELRSMAIEHLRYGEIGALRRGIAVAGADEAVLAQRYRSQRERQTEVLRNDGSVSSVNKGVEKN